MIEQRFRLTCDECSADDRKKQFLEGSSVADVQGLGWQFGWYTGTRYDLCPRHATKDNKR